MRWPPNHSRAQSAARSPAQTPMRHAPIHVLNVNDDHGARAYKSAMLTAAGFAVREAVRGDDALHRIAADPPDLILLDVHLPDANGIDIGRRLQPPPASPDTFEGDRAFAIALISAHLTQPEDIARGMAAGADAYLVEPLDDTYLVGLIRALVERHMRRRAAAAERAALRARDDRYRILAATVGDAIYDWDLGKDRVEWNDAVSRLLRYPGDSVGETSQWWVDRIHPDDRGRVMSEVRRVLGARLSTNEVEYRFERGDGSFASVADRSTITYAVDGRPERVIGAMTDITERRRLADQLRVAQKMEAVGLLAGGIAHDFNNVLTTVIGFADLLKVEVDDRPAALEHATEIASAANRAAELISQLLAFSRRQVLKAEVLDVNQVVRSSTRMLHRLIGAHIRLDLRLEDRLSAVRADQTQLEQVLMNLVVNARDAMPAGGVLTVTTEVVNVPRTPREQRIMPRGRYVKVAVTDTGVGMDDSTRVRMFEPFFTTKERGRGTGLGLATVYGIVKQSGCYIWVTSTPGEGTTFDIYLPAVALPAEAARPRPLVAPVDSSAAGETILVVEHEPGVRRLAHQVLARAGYRVLEAADGLEAISLAGQYSGPIDLLLTDLVLPGVSGTAVADSLRRARPAVRVLYTSGYSRETHVAGRLADVPHQLLPKPFTRDALLLAARHALTALPGEPVQPA